MRFSYDSQKRYFLKDGKPHFFKLDTAWLSFINLGVEEFEEYVRFRKSQGFNGILVMNTPAFQDMPVNTRYFPFHIRDDGSYDLSVISEEYLQVCRQKMDILQRYDMTAFLALMWVSFISGSQMEKVFDCTGKQFQRFEDYRTFADRCIELYKPYHPVWLLGGDAKLDADSRTNFDYYSYMGRRIRRECPGDLLSAHVAGGSYIDKAYFENGLIDFYTYQSSHMMDTHGHYMAPAVMGKKCWDAEPVLPVMNLEPMYEAHGYGNRFGRFGAADVRRAFWYSVLSGAKAGFAYGAHGIWMFYDGSGFNNEYWSKVPMDWRSALTLPGGYDFAYCADLFERFGMFDLEPAQEMNLMPWDEIRFAASPDKKTIVTYTPAMTYIDMAVDLRQYDCRWFVLGGGKKVCRGKIDVFSGKELEARNDALCRGQLFPNRISPDLANAPLISRVEMPQHNSDALLVCVQREN